MIVVDASIGIKWLKQNEKDAQIALNIFNDHLKRNNPIIVPSLFFLEIANVLALNKQITPKTLTDSLNFLNKSGIKVHSFTKANLVDCATLAEKHGTTVYGMLYTVVAKERNCDLVTADQNFVKKTRFPFVKLLSTLN